MKRYIKGNSNKSLIDTAVKEAINMFMEYDYDYVLNKIKNNEPLDPTSAFELDNEIEFLKDNNLVDGLSESDIRVVAKTVLKKIEDIENDLYHSYSNFISEDIEGSDYIVDYDKYHTNLNSNKKLSRAEFIDTVLSKGYIALDHKQARLYYVVTKVNDTNFGDMSTKLRDQLETEGLYDNSYIGFFSHSMNPPYTVQMLPIYGNPNKYVTSWFTASAKQAIEQDLKDRQIGLLSRANEYINDI